MKNLGIAQHGRTFQLSFALPQLATDGERLTKPLEVEILRAVGAPRRGAPPAPGALSPWKTLQGDDLARYTQGEKLTFAYSFSDDEFRQQRGWTFTFAVRTLTHGFRRHVMESDISNIAQAVLVDVPEPVQNLRVRAEEHALALTWSPSTQSINSQPGSKLTAYRVYRSQTGKPLSFQLRGETADPAYRDAEFEFGRVYFYKVTAVAKQDGSVAESEDSEMVEITPRDVFPPAVPTGLSAVYTTDAVELIWTANSEPDLAGYNVYRRQDDGPAQKVNPKILRTPIFRDSSVETGRKYFYRVTALDLANNESAPSEEVSVEIR